MANEQASVSVSASVHMALKTLAVEPLVDLVLKRVDEHGKLCGMSRLFLQSLLHNACKIRNNWKWPPGLISFLGNILCRVGRKTYEVLCGNMNITSLATVKRTLTLKTLDVVSTSENAILKTRNHFDERPHVPPSVIVQNDGISIKGGIAWSKETQFLGFMPSVTSLAHALLSYGVLESMELAEVYISQRYFLISK